MDRINVETTQNVAIEYEIASVGERILANLLDSLIIIGYFLLIAIVYSIAFTFSKSTTGIVIMILLGLPVMLYNLLCETFMNGQSFGKRFRKIKVIRVDGNQATFGNYLLRWILRLIEVLPYGLIAIITIIINGKGQRLGDIAAGTMVIKLRDKQKLSDSAFGKTDENYAPVFMEARLLSDQDVALINQALWSSQAANRTLILEKLSTKLKAHLKIETKLNNEEFLRTLLKDFSNIYR